MTDALHVDHGTAQSDQSPAVNLNRVLNDELEAIQERRHVVSEARAAETTPGNDLVGLALSGGGLRSAMFNLGFLQSLQESGFMKFVDYLSTVSGGGYVGGFYSTIGHNFTPDSKESTEGANTKVDTAAGSIPTRNDDGRRRLPNLNRATHRFINAGQYLNQPWEFLAVYVCPSIAVFLLFFSALVIGASAVAMFLRLFDFPAVNDHLTLMGLDAESSSLCVSIVALWLVLIFIEWGMRFASRDRHRSVQNRKVTQHGTWLKLMVVAIMCGTTIMLGNYDFGLTSGTTVQFQGMGQLPLAIIAVVAMLSLFRLPLLLRSEQTTASFWHKAALWLILSSAVGGGSLAVLMYIGSEDISGYSTLRGPQLDNEDVIDYRAFGVWLKELNGSTRLSETKLADYQDSVEELDLQRRNLFPDNSKWPGNISTILHADDARRLVRYFARFAESQHPISRYLAQLKDVRTKRNALIEDINGEFFPVLDQSTKKLINTTPTTELLKQFSNRVETPRKDESPSDRTHVKFVPGIAATNPVEVRKNIATYLDAARNHADRPMLGQAAFLKNLAPMIQRDGQLRYTGGQLEPHAEMIFRRQLLEMTYPNVFKQQAFVSTPVVVGKDQLARLCFFSIAVVVFAAMCWYVDFNKHAAVFQFYRERIARTFIEAGGRNRFDADLPLSNFAPWKKGFPYPLISAALRLPESVDINQLTPHELDENPSKVDGSVGSEWYSFLLSPKYVGYLPVIPGGDRRPGSPALKRTYRRTDAYLANELKVSDAVTLSGAAFTPWMASSSALNLLMHVFNLRLEQWLPNPEYPVCLHEKQPMKLWRLLRERLRCSTREGLKKWQWGVVADGGFREFLGVEELLVRRCRIVVVSDAGCNNGLSEFGVLADLVRQARLDHDVRILDLDHDLPLDTVRMTRTPDGRGIQHFIVGRIRYPEIDKSESLYSRTGLFVYVQMALTGDEDVDLAQFQKIHPTFPDEPITNQFFTSDQVESLRQLGEHVGRHLCQRLNPENVQLGQGDDRLERLADALVGAYLVECRQEQYVSTEDTPPDMPVISGGINPEAVNAFRLYEERGEAGRRLAHFVTAVVDGYSAEDSPTLRGPSPIIAKLANEITAKDLTGLAVECNRRHVGFTSENPSRYFRIGGRRLLLRSTSRAIEVYENLMIDERNLTAEELKARFDANLPHLIRAIARLSIIVPEGIFRLHGVETSRELVLSVLSWFGSRIGYEFLHLEQWINRASFRRGLELAIRTGLAEEVEMFLTAVLVEGKAPEISTGNRLSLGHVEPTSVILLNSHGGPDDDEGNGEGRPPAAMKAKRPR